MLPKEIRCTAFLASALSGLVLIVSLLAMIQIQQEVNSFREELDTEIGQFRVGHSKLDKIQGFMAGIYGWHVDRFKAVKPCQTANIPSIRAPRTSTS